jgi:hypothetical protein
MRMNNILKICIVVISVSFCLFLLSLPIWYLLNLFSHVNLLCVFAYILLSGICIALYEISKNAKTYKTYLNVLIYGIACILFIALWFYLQTNFIQGSN